MPSSDNKSIFGFYDDPHATRPAYDPGREALCPYCLTPVGHDRPIKTISLMGANPKRSYFYRVHADCLASATSEDVQRVEGAVIDAEVADQDEWEKWMLQQQERHDKHMRKLGGPHDN